MRKIEWTVENKRTYTQWEWTATNHISFIITGWIEAEETER
jgi:hypothetical protein